MGRIIAFDYGSKRIGIAVTDPLQIIATGLTSLHSKDVIEFLKKYLAKEEVSSFVVGIPKKLNNTKTHSTKLVETFINLLNKNFPDIPIKRVDERFTSKIAQQAILMSGVKKKDRRSKKHLDETSAIIILQSYLEQLETKK